MKKLVVIFIILFTMVGISYSKKDNDKTYINSIKLQKSIDNLTNSNKDIGEISFEIGNIYFSINRYDKAIKMFKKSIRYGYNDSDVYYLLSVCYKELKDYGKSMYFLNKAVQIVEAELRRINVSKN